MVAFVENEHKFYRFIVGQSVTTLREAGFDGDKFPKGTVATICKRFSTDGKNECYGLKVLNKVIPDRYLGSELEASVL